MHQLEFSDGTAHKYWQIARNHLEVTIQWGRIGTKGQSQSKTFASETEAEAFLNAQLQAKLKKGYLRVASETPSVNTPSSEQQTGILQAQQSAKSRPKISQSINSIDATCNTAPSLEASTKIVPETSPVKVAWTPTLRTQELQVMYCKFSYPKNELTPLPPPTDLHLAWKKLGPEMQKGLQKTVWLGDKAWQELGMIATQTAQSLQPPTLSQDVAGVFMALSRRREAVDFIWSKLGAEATLQAWLASRQLQQAQRYNAEAKGYVNEIIQTASPTPLQFWDLSNPKIWALRQKITELSEAERTPLIQQWEDQRSQLSLAERLGLDWIFWDQEPWLASDLEAWLTLDTEADPELWHSGWLLWPCLRQPELLDAIAERFLSASKKSSDRWEMLAEVLEPTLFWLLERAGVHAAKSLFAWIQAGKRASVRKKAVNALALIQSKQTLQLCVDLLKHKDAAKMAHAKLASQPLEGAHALLKGLRKRKSYPEAEELLTGLLRSMDQTDIASFQEVWGSAAAPYLPKTQTSPQAQHLPNYFEALLRPTPLLLALPALKGVDLPTGPAQMDFSRSVIVSSHAFQPYIYDPPPASTENDANMLKRFAEFPRLMNHHLDWLSDTAALKLWNETPPERWNPHDRDDWAFKNLALRFGVAGLPGFLRRLESSPDPLYMILCYFDSPQVVPALLKGLKLAAHRVPCKTWFLRHPRTALRGLIPLICNPHWQLQWEALRALHLLLTGQGAVPPPLSLSEIEAELQQWPPDVQTAIQALLTQDPCTYLPPKWPSLPAFFIVSQLPPLELKTGEVLPPEAVQAVGLTLILNSPGLPYAGVAQVSQLCTAESLEAFSLALFERWLGDGGALKHEWAFWGLAFWGREAGVRLLVPRLEKWPGERSVQRALLGLEILAQMPMVENAWPELHRLSLKTRYPSVQERATLWLSRLAEDLPGGADRLVERLVLRLGLDPASGRDFQHSQEEGLRGQILSGGLLVWRDAQGKKISKFPSHIPVAETKALKAWQKEVEQQLKFQKIALERAMYQGRRWRLSEFEQHLSDHPLLKPLLTGLIWGVYPSEAASAQLQAVLCLTDAGLWNTLEGQLFPVSPEQFLGLVHPLEIADACTKWQTLLQAMELIQPFEQLQRAIFHLDAADKRGIKAPGKVPSSKVLGLISGADWHVPKHSEGNLSKDFGRGYQAEILLEYQIWALKEYPDVDVFRVNLNQTGVCACSVGEADLSRVDPIVYSELKRDLARLF